MRATRYRRGAAVAAVTSAVLALSMTPAMAHGGSADPPAEQQECRDLDLNEKGEGSNAQDGTTTAGDTPSAVEWDHC